MTPTTAALPWAGRDHHCFGCSPANGRGLQLDFTRTGGALETSFRLDRHYESYPGVAHGGIVAVICDETLGNLVVLELGAPAVTTTMRMRYVGVVAVDREYRCVAQVDATRNGLIHGRADVFDGDGALVAVGTAAYRPRTHPSPATT